MAVVRASLADQIKAHLTPEAIHDREQAMLRALLQRWGAHNNIRVYGSLDPAARVPIVSFNVFQVPLSKACAVRCGGGPSAQRNSRESGRLSS